MWCCPVRHFHLVHFQRPRLAHSFSDKRQTRQSAIIATSPLAAQFSGATWRVVVNNSLRRRLQPKNCTWRIMWKPDVIHKKCCNLYCGQSGPNHGHRLYGNVVKFWYLFLRCASGQTDPHTDTLFAILRTPPESEVITNNRDYSAMYTFC